MSWVVDGLETWTIETCRELAAHPETWPVEREAPIPDHPFGFWGGLCIRRVPIYGVETWLCDAVAHTGPKGKTLMSMRLTSSTDAADVCAYLAAQAEAGCPKPLSYINFLCEKLLEKDDDPHDDWW